MDENKMKVIFTYSNDCLFNGYLIVPAGWNQQFNCLSTPDEQPFFIGELNDTTSWFAIS